MKNRIGSARRLVVVLGVLAGTVGVVGGWAAQPADPPKQPEAPKTRPGSMPVSRPAPKPGTPAAPTTPAPAKPGDPTTPAARPVAPVAPTGIARPRPELGKYMTRQTSKDWTLTAYVRLDSDSPDEKTNYYDANSKKTASMPNVTAFEFESAAIVYPLVSQSASSEAKADDVKGMVRFDGAEVGDKFELMRGSYHAGTKLMRFDTNGVKNGNGKVACREVTLEVSVPTTCYKVQFDEAKAALVPWPKGQWPEDAVLALGPQLYVENGLAVGGIVVPYKDDETKAALKRYLAEEGIDDVAKSTPLAVAKAITKGVWADVQTSGDGLKYRARTGEVAGIDLQPPDQTLAQQKGSEHDLTVLMAALFRKAGLPVRTVIGFDVNDPRNNKFLKNIKKEKKLRSWVEFYLYDEAKNSYNWVPVDVNRMRKQSSRPPAAANGVERPWAFFGTNNEMDAIVPFALHFHPPTDVASYGSPAFFGWFVTPKAPEVALQALTFRAEISAKKGGDNAEPVTDEEDPAVKQNDKDREKDKDKKKAAAKKLRGG